MWFVAALLAQSVALPTDTPIPCLVCKAESTAPPLRFSGMVQFVGPRSLRLFNGQTHQSMGFTVPANFHGVASSDGVIKDAPVTRVPLGLLVRVTYRIAGGHHEATEVLLLTINQCRALMAAERLTNTRVECPD